MLLFFRENFAVLIVFCSLLGFINLIIGERENSKNFTEIMVVFIAFPIWIGLPQWTFAIFLFAYMIIANTILSYYHNQLRVELKLILIYSAIMLSWSPIPILIWLEWDEFYIILPFSIIISAGILFILVTQIYWKDLNWFLSWISISILLMLII